MIRFYMAPDKSVQTTERVALYLVVHKPGDTWVEIGGYNDRATAESARYYAGVEGLNAFVVRTADAMRPPSRKEDV